MRWLLFVLVFGAGFLLGVVVTFSVLTRVIEEWVKGNPDLDKAVREHLRRSPL